MISNFYKYLENILLDYKISFIYYYKIIPIWLITKPFVALVYWYKFHFISLKIVYFMKNPGLLKKKGN